MSLYKLITGLALRVVSSERQNKQYRKKIDSLKESKQIKLEFNVTKELRKLKRNLNKYPTFKQQTKQLFLKEFQQEENRNRIIIKKDAKRIEQIAVHTYLSGMSRRQYNVAKKHVCKYYVRLFELKVDKLVRLTNLSKQIQI